MTAKKPPQPQSHKPPEPRKQPRQSRSKETVRAIRQACARIVYQQGPKAVTTARIADLAGVNIASLYQYFPNKEAVLADFYEIESAALADLSTERFALINRLSKKSLEKTLAAIIDLEVQQLHVLSRLHPDFFASYHASYDIHERVNSLTKEHQNPSWEEWFPEFLGLHGNRLRSRNLRLLSDVAYGALRGAMQTVVRLNQESAASHTDSPVTATELTTLKCEILYLLLAYLLQDRPCAEQCKQFFDLKD